MSTVIDFVSQARSADFGDLLDLGSEWFWVLFNIVVVLLKNYGLVTFARSDICANDIRAK
jgi:hypothetical protein